MHSRRTWPYRQPLLTSERRGEIDQGIVLLAAVALLLLMLAIGGGLMLWQRQRAQTMMQVVRDQQQMRAEQARQHVDSADQHAAADGKASTLPHDPRIYADMLPALERFIAREIQLKEIPGLSIALVDHQTIVWAKGFGLANPRTKASATADTVYRVGSVSKLFTDIAVMQLVEKGLLDLDAPVSRYLPDFKPANPFGKPITLRQLMTHRSGLVREPPAGHYFDPAQPTLAETVASLNRTELVYEPETKIKYSNAGIAVVGLVLERTQNKPFARYVQQALLEPLGLKHSSFEPPPAEAADLAAGMMWSYHGLAFEAPTFALGMIPAGSMYSTVNDLGQFLAVLFKDGKGPGEQIVTAATLQHMWTPQFAKAKETAGFGIGFALNTFEGRRLIHHGGAIYGFATELAALPDDKLGVVVVATRDVLNAVTERIARVALAQMLAARKHQPAPKIEETGPVNPNLARKVAGRYGQGDKAVDLVERTGKLFLLPAKGGFRTEIRAVGDGLITDDRLGHGQRIAFKDGRMTIGSDVLDRVADHHEAPSVERWRGLIGEYGWDHDVLYILEKDGKLHALIEWFFLYPLQEISAGVFKFPDWGLYQDEKLVFARDAAGRATQVEVGGILFKRRTIDGENGATFRIRAQRPLEDLRHEALAGQPPREAGQFRAPDLVEVTALDPTIKLDIRYATTNNFLSTPFYSQAKAFLQRPVAEAVVRVHRKLETHGLGLLVYDGYRPWYVTKMFWEATPEKYRIFVANPALASRHNRGAAVDLTLYDRKTGKPVEMVGGYDEFSDRSYPDYLGGTSPQRHNRDLLRRQMEAEGFTVYEAEWWHFDYKDWKQYPILNVAFERLAGLAK